MTSPRRTMEPPAQTAIPFVQGSGLGLVFEERDAGDLLPVNRDPRDVSNWRLLQGLTVVSPYDIPKIQACTLVPERLISFSEAMRMQRPDATAWVHFYEDDYRFERFWRSPEKYLERLSAFAGVISPDFSLYRNMPTAQKIHNTFRNQLLGAWLQARGLEVIANVRISGRDSAAHALAGTPHRSTLALGLHGCTKDVTNRGHVVEEIQLVCEVCQPENLVVYGSSMYGVLEPAHALDIPVHLYAPDHRFRSAHREAA